MTNEEIKALGPGSELNAKVAEEIMGYEVISDQTLGYMVRRAEKDGGSSVWDSPPLYSEDVEAAHAVIDVMLERGYDKAVDWEDLGPEEICKEALRALAEDKEKTAASLP